MDQLPPWLTRQYDYNEGFRGIGRGWLAGTQRNALQYEMGERVQRMQNAAQETAMRQQGLQMYEQTRRQMLESGQETDPEKAAMKAYVQAAPYFNPKGAAQAYTGAEGLELREAQNKLAEARQKFLEENAIREAARKTKEAADREQRIKDLTREGFQNKVSINDERNTTATDIAEKNIIGRKDVAVLNNANKSTERDQIGFNHKKMLEAQEAGDDELAKLYQARNIKLSQATGMTIRSNPDGTYEITQGPVGAGGMERSTKGELEKKINAGLTSLSLLDESIGAISPSNTGPVGKAYAAYEKVGNILQPGSVGTQTTEARQKFKLTATQLYQSLKADSQINKLEAEGLKDLADITSWDEASDTARQKYQTLRDLTSLQLILRSKEAGKPVPDAALKGLTPDAAARYWKRGDMTNDDVTRANQLNGWVP